MSLYWKEWPLLVLTPSSARYHWESEFQQWLGRDSPVNNPENQSGEKACPTNGNDENEKDEADANDTPLAEYRQQMRLLENTEINVLTSGKEPVLPDEHTRVVVCSFGLAPGLVESGKITPGMFKCAIVDER